MIDIKKAEQEFKNYTSKYDMSQLRLKRKVTHTFRVENICKSIAISLGMNEEEINLAKLIGLLHDIARFEQYTRYKTYDDHKSIDHADFGVEMLEKDNYLRKYVETNKYDSVILKAIQNHNKYSIQENLNEEEKLYCKIIRDADKLDIIYQATCKSWKDNIKDMEKQIVSSKVLEQFFQRQSVNKKDTNYDIDRIVVIVAFIYDLNFKGSYKIIKENNYIDKIINRFNFEKEETRKQIEEIRIIANEDIDNKLKEE